MNNNFLEIINDLESLKLDEDFMIIKGKIPVMISAPHTINQKRKNGEVKLSEPFTKALALYLNKYLGCYCIIKNIDTGIDANSDDNEEYKEALIKCVNNNDIRLVLDLHGAKETRDFDIDLGTLNNLSADFSSIRELEEAFLENGVYNVTHNQQFKGGGITKNLYGKTNADAIQIEINKKFRDLKNIQELEKICISLISFINFYVNK